MEHFHNAYAEIIFLIFFNIMKIFKHTSKIKEVYNGYPHSYHLDFSINILIC